MALQAAVQPVLLILRPLLTSVLFVFRLFGPLARPLWAPTTAAACVSASPPWWAALLASRALIAPSGAVAVGLLGAAARPLRRLRGRAFGAMLKGGASSPSSRDASNPGCGDRCGAAAPAEAVPSLEEPLDESAVSVNEAAAGWSMARGAAKAEAGMMPCVAHDGGACPAHADG
eukprot:6954564-Prymnesium_polylepis.1